MNFLGVGNDWVEIQLNRSKSTLVHGKNGAGKSGTILDALMFGLYGKAYRNINKPKLVNSIIGKNCLVEVEFSIGKKKYLVRRGIAPDIFEIYVNGAILKQTGTRDYQKQFVKTVLKISDKSFKQIVVLGSANYVHFMQLETYKRREIIEDLLDIQVFSTMNLLLKEKLNNNKTRLNEIETQIKIQENKIELSKKHINSMRANNDDLIELRNSKIEKYIEENQNYLCENSIYQSEIDEFSSKCSNYDQVKSKLDKLIDIEKQLNQKSEQLRKDIEFFHDNDNCPTCKQGIDHDFKSETISQREEKTKEIEEASAKLKESYEKLNSELAVLTDISQKISELNSKIRDNNSEISFNQKNIIALGKEIEDLRAKSKTIEEDHSSLQEHIAELKKTTKEKEVAVKYQNILEISNTLLKDTGIKTKIISQFIPIMNKVINKYLSDLDFFVDFQLDENFNEVIKSRHRDAFAFESFSEGEKAKISFSLLLTWRHIAKIRNSASTNLLILDEIFDGGTDSETLDAIVSLLHQLENTHFFMISHNPALNDKLHSSIEFVKKGNFSHIERKSAA